MKQSKESIKQKIFDYIKSKRGRLIPKHELENLNRVFGCYAETIDRKARQLYNDHDRIDRIYKNNLVHYYYIKA